MVEMIPIPKAVLNIHKSAMLILSGNKTLSNMKNRKQIHHTDTDTEKEREIIYTIYKIICIYYVYIELIFPTRLIFECHHYHNFAHVHVHVNCHNFV